MSDLEWIKNLKVGDEVAIDVGRYSTEYKIAKVDRITSSGRIVIGDRTFNANGMERGGDTWHKQILRQLTEDLRANIIEKRERVQLLNKIDQCNFRTLSTDTLRQIAALLDA